MPPTDPGQRPPQLRPQRRPRPRQKLRWLAVPAAALAVLLGACATVPDSGSVQPGSGGTAAAAAVAGQGYLLQPITVRPGPTWTPTQIVRGFLDATASFAGDYAAARQFLAPGTSWHPTGFAADVIDAQPSMNQVPSPVKPPTQQISATVASVQVQGKQLATVTRGGQYQAMPQRAPYSWQVLLRKTNAGWRIAKPPPMRPPLYEPDFHRVYLPRELYFVAGDGGSLVPDPVFVPLQATAVDVARQLVTALQDGPPYWLDGATRSALRLVPSPATVTMDAGTATVNLRVNAALRPKLQTSQIMSQLVWTLASPSFAQSAIVQSVQLDINGYPQSTASWAGGQPAAGDLTLLALPRIAAGQPLYSVAGREVLQRLSTRELLQRLPNRSPVTSRIPVRAGDGQIPLGAIAVSPGGHDVAWAATQPGQGLYFGPLRSGARLTRWVPPGHGRITSVSWAANGSLWVVAGGQIWMLQLGHRATPLGGSPNGQVLSLQIAPDNVRAAMIVKSGDGNQLELGAIQYFPTGSSLGPVSMVQTIAIGTDVSDPIHLAWYDPDDLIVLSSSPAGPTLKEVPVNGGDSTPVVAVGDTQTISSAGPANPLVAGLRGGSLALNSSLDGTWIPKKDAGLYPTYPAP